MVLVKIRPGAVRVSSIYSQASKVYGSGASTRSYYALPVNDGSGFSFFLTSLFTHLLEEDLIKLTVVRRVEC